MDRKLGGLIAVGLLAAGGLWAYVDMRESDRARAFNTSQWLDISHTDPMTDKRRVMFLAQGTNTVTTAYGREIRPEMVLSCSEGKATLAFMVGGLRISEGDHSVLLRMDDAAPESHEFFSAGKDTMGANESLVLVRQLAAGKYSKLLVRIPTGDGTKDALFDISDIAEPAEAILQACN